MSEPAAIMSQRAKAIRSERGHSLDRVAKSAGISKTHLWEIEAGRTANPTIGVAQQLARALGVSLHYLIGENDTLPDLHPEALRVAIEIDAILRKAESCTPSPVSRRQ